MPEVEAHTTGTIWETKEVGQEVAAGDTVVILLESLKTEMPVEAEDEGTVGASPCQEGQAVSEGQTPEAFD